MGKEIVNEERGKCWSRKRKQGMKGKENSRGEWRYREKGERRGAMNVCVGRGGKGAVGE